MKTVIPDTRTSYATDKQRRYISQLRARLGIKDQIEEEVMTDGEAGRLIRELEPICGEEDLSLALTARYGDYILVKTLVLYLK